MCERRCLVMVAVLLFTTPAAHSETFTQATWRVADKVEAAVHDSLAAMKREGNAVRDKSHLDLQSIAAAFGYNLGRRSSSILGDNDVHVEYVQLQTPDAHHDTEVRLALITGSRVEKVRRGLFESMGTRLSLPINAGTFRLLTGGPGDACFTMPSNIQSESAGLAVEKRIWFIRDNVGVELACSGETDILPMAVAIDEAIKSCPQRETASPE